LFFVVFPTLRTGLESFTFDFFNAGLVAGFLVVVVSGLEGVAGLEGVTAFSFKPERASVSFVFAASTIACVLADFASFASVKAVWSAFQVSAVYLLLSSASAFLMEASRIEVFSCTVPDTDG